MKIIVVSDTHGHYSLLAELMDMHRDADALIFLGDGINDLARADAYSYPFAVYSVRGNCDGISFFSRGNDAPDEMILSLGGYRFFILHGHTRTVKHSMDRAIWAAQEQAVDVLLFGHTHCPMEKYLSFDDGGECSLKPLYLFNPGSLGASGDGASHFGLIQIKDGNILFSLGTLQK